MLVGKLGNNFSLGMETLLNANGNMRNDCKQYEIFSLYRLNYLSLKDFNSAKHEDEISRKLTRIGECCNSLPP
jgi:hypothetical protein